MADIKALIAEGFHVCSHCEVNPGECVVIVQTGNGNSVENFINTIEEAGYTIINTTMRFKDFMSIYYTKTKV